MGRNRHRFAAFTQALAALALAIQCFVVETHVDGLAFAPAAEATAQVSAEHAGKGAPAVCIICQDAALSRVATLAGPPPIGVVEHTLFLSAPPLRAPLIETRALRPWQSRAPPISA